MSMSDWTTFYTLELRIHLTHIHRAGLATSYVSGLWANRHSNDNEIDGLVQHCNISIANTFGDIIVMH